MDYRQKIIEEFGANMLNGLEAFGEVNYKEEYENLIKHGAVPNFETREVKALSKDQKIIVGSIYLGMSAKNIYKKFRESDLVSLANQVGIVADKSGDKKETIEKLINYYA